jgi:hypothetical protein
MTQEPSTCRTRGSSRTGSSLDVLSGQKVVAVTVTEAGHRADGAAVARLVRGLRARRAHDAGPGAREAVVLDGGERVTY